MVTRDKESHYVMIKGLKHQQYITSSILGWPKGSFIFFHKTVLEALSCLTSFETILLDSIVTAVVQFSSVTQLCLTFCDPMDCSMPGFPVHDNSRSLLKLMSIELVTPSNHLILCCLLLLPPSIFSSTRVFSNKKNC